MDHSLHLNHSLAHVIHTKFFSSVLLFIANLLGSPFFANLKVNFAASRCGTELHSYFTCLTYWKWRKHTDTHTHTHTPQVFRHRDAKLFVSLIVLRMKKDKKCRRDMLGFWTLVCFCSENKEFMFLELAFTPTPFDTQSVSFRCQSDLVKLLCLSTKMPWEETLFVHGKRIRDQKKNKSHLTVESECIM